MALGQATGAQAQAKLNAYDELIKQAQGAGVDPRSIEYFQGLRQTAAQQQAAYTRTLRKKKSGLGGFVRKATSFLGGGKSIEKYRTLATEAALRVTDAEGQLRSDITKQIELQKIRRERRSNVEEQATGSLFKRGKSALLSSTAGGGGFFSGYFE